MKYNQNNLLNVVRLFLVNFIQYSVVSNNLGGANEHAGEGCVRREGLGNSAK